MKSFVIIGMGLFGRRLATDLYDTGHQVLAIDIKPERIEAVADYVSRAVSFDAKNRDALAAVGVDRYDTAVVATTEDLSAAILIVMNLKTFNIPKIICKAKSKSDKQILETLGGVEVIIPEHIAADKLTQKVTHPNVIEYTNFSEQYDLVETKIPSGWVGKSVAELNVRAKYGVNILAIRTGDTLNVTFDPNKPLQSRDSITIIADKKQIEKILRQV